MDRRTGRKGRVLQRTTPQPVDYTERSGGWGHPRDYSDFKGLVFGICRRHKRTATLNWMSFEFIDFAIAANVVPRARRSFSTSSRLRRPLQQNRSFRLTLPLRAWSVRPRLSPLFLSCVRPTVGSGR